MKKLTWKKIATLVHLECDDVPADTCERVLRAFANLTGPELDPECDLINAFHRLDPEEDE